MWPMGLYTGAVYSGAYMCIAHPKVSDGMQHVSIAYLFLKHVFRKIYNFGNIACLFLFILLLCNTLT
jgi:hypothetical protein